MSLIRVSAIVMMAGSAIFLVAAFSPLSRVFTERSPERKLEIITAAGSAWPVHQVLFGLGAFIAAVGLVLLAAQLRVEPVAPALFVSAGLMLAGSVLWARHLYIRSVDPALFAEGLMPFWLFAGYTLLTIAGLALFGYVLLQMPVASWVGWMMIGSMGFFLLMALIFGDLPPFVHYVVLMIAAVMLYRMAPVEALQ
jgi:hypothetical protein